MLHIPSPSSLHCRLQIPHSCKEDCTHVPRIAGKATATMFHHVSPHTNPSAASGAEGGMQVLWPPPKHDSSSKCLTCEAIKGLTILSSNLSPHDMLRAAP